jgi:hypothetical protein
VYGDKGSDRSPPLSTQASHLFVSHNPPTRDPVRQRSPAGRRCRVGRTIRAG